MLRVIVARFARFSRFALFALVVPACGKDIGDPCTTSIDCSNNGDRDCDQSQPGGYCTINGCDEQSCPSEAVCIRIFPYVSPASACQGDTDCTSDHMCLPDGTCASRSAERRYCEKTCGKDGDCRGGYVCREAGLPGHTPTGPIYGSVALVANANANTVIRFCAPP